MLCSYFDALIVNDIGQFLHFTPLAVHISNAYVYYRLGVSLCILSESTMAAHIVVFQGFRVQNSSFGLLGLRF